MARIVEEALRRYLPEIERFGQNLIHNITNSEERVPFCARISHNVYMLLRQVSEKLNLSYSTLVELALKMYFSEGASASQEVKPEIKSSDDLSSIAYRIYEDLYVPALRSGTLC